jgi:PAS domain S-box-containing protein
MFSNLVKPPIVLLMLLILGLTPPAFAQTKPQVDLTGKNILVLHAHEANAPVFVRTDKGLSSTLQSGGISSQNQFFEYLNLRRYPGSAYRRLLVEQMRMQYRHRKPDIIITMFPEAVEFVLKDCRDIFPHVPILALYLPESFEVPKTERLIIGHFPTVDIMGTLEIALKLVPGAKRVYVVSGAHQVDKKVEDQARRISEHWGRQLEFLYLSKMPLEDILADLRTAPARSIILLLTFSQDVTGKNKTSPEVAQRLSQISTAPIFGILDVTLGHGIIGGSLINFELIGTKAGQLALDILGGTKASDNIPEVLDVPSLPMFDWRQLRRWKLSEAALPKGSIVINKEPTLRDFRYYIFVAMAFCLAEATLILFLIVQRRRKIAAEEALRLRNQYIETILEQAPIGFAIHTINDGVGQFVSARFEEIYGVPRGTIDSHYTFFDKVWPDRPDLREEIRRRVVADMDSGDAPRMRWENIPVPLRSGETRYITAMNIPVLDQNLMVSTVQDVTERVRAEEDLRTSEERFRQFFKNIPDYCYIVSAEGNILHINEAALKTLGYKREELIGKPLATIYAPQSWSKMKALLDQWKKEGEIKNEEMVILTRSGEKRLVLLNVGAVRDAEGKIIHSTSIQTDITDWEKAQVEIERQRQELIHVSRVGALGQLASSLAHEINQPLAAILFNAQAAQRFLGQKKPNLEELREILKDIINDNERASEVIRKIRSLIKKKEFEFEKQDINNLVRETSELLAAYVKRRNKSIRLQPDPDLPLVDGDRVQLQQVLLNLITNGIDAMVERGPAAEELVIRTSKNDSNSVVITVKDSGSGLPDKDPQRVFEPFYTTKPEGLGMGLVISRSIVEGHGGTLQAENNPDNGATFYVTIPVEAAKRT